LSEGSLLEMNTPDIYNMCLEEAKKGSMRGGNGEGAILYAFMKNAGLIVFKNRCRHKRDFLEDYGLSYSGFQEHAEQAVLNDAIKFVRDNDDVIMGAYMFIAGFHEGSPYRYKDKMYICMNCASYMKETLPLYSTVIYLPAEEGWHCFSVFELYKMACAAYADGNKTSELRKEYLEATEDES